MQTACFLSLKTVLVVCIFLEAGGLEAPVAGLSCIFRARSWAETTFIWTVVGTASVLVWSCLLYDFPFICGRGNSQKKSTNTFLLSGGMKERKCRKGEQFETAPDVTSARSHWITLHMSQAFCPAVTAFGSRCTAHTGWCQTLSGSPVALS